MLTLLARPTRSSSRYPVTLAFALWAVAGCGAPEHAAPPRHTPPNETIPTGAATDTQTELVEAPLPPQTASTSAPADEEALAAEPGQPLAPPPAPASRPAEEESKRKDVAAMHDLLSGSLGMGRAAPRPEASRAQGTGSGPRALRSKVAQGSLGAVGYGIGGGGSALAAQPPPREFQTEAYAHRADNAFQHVQDAPLSTFSIDVDTASYANVRRFLTQGTLPPADAVRIEEMVNYFDYDYQAPRGEEPFSVHTEVATAPWNPKHRLLHIGLQGRVLDQREVPARNLVFLIDVSGSMHSADKLPLLVRGLSMLARDLRPQDRIAIAVYAGSSGLVLPATSGRDKARILDALQQLSAGGSTNGAEGIELAYRVARHEFVKGGINRVILATDGDFNVGVTSEGELTRLIEKERESGVFLTVLGFGTGNLKDSTMEQLADKGNGNYAYIDSDDEAHKVLVREAGSTLVTIAKDVKLQVEFNPTRVESYRLIGYENRVLADRDFNDDKKDAGEIGAGHSVTALYEVVLRDNATPSAGEVDPLRYQHDRALKDGAHSDELAMLKLRFKAPQGDTSQLRSTAVRDTGLALEQAGTDFRFAAAVAGFGMVLRKSEARGAADLAKLRVLAQGALGTDPHGDRAQLLQLMHAATRLGAGS